MEWTADDFLPGKLSMKLVKGGSWMHPCRLFALVHARMRGLDRMYRGPELGFRCAKSAGPKP
jgi:formylglycine-generating enzyme required for sulfatase activity